MKGRAWERTSVTNTKSSPTPALTADVAYPLTVYYDGACPICRREICLMRKWIARNVYTSLTLQRGVLQRQRVACPANALALG